MSDSKKINFRPTVKVVRTYDPRIINTLKNSIVSTMPDAIHEELAAKQNYFVVNNTTVPLYWNGSVYKGVPIYSTSNMPTHSILTAWFSAYRCLPTKTCPYRNNGFISPMYSIEAFGGMLQSGPSSVAFNDVVTQYQINRTAANIAVALTNYVWEERRFIPLASYLSEKGYAMGSATQNKSSYNEPSVVVTMRLRTISKPVSAGKQKFIEDLFRLYNNMNFYRKRFLFTDDVIVSTENISSQNYLHPSITLINFPPTSKQVRSTNWYRQVVPNKHVVTRMRIARDITGGMYTLPQILIALPYDSVYQEDINIFGFRHNRVINVARYEEDLFSTWNSTLSALWTIFNMLEYRTPEIKEKFLNFILFKLGNTMIQGVAQARTVTAKTQLTSFENRKSAAVANLIASEDALNRSRLTFDLLKSNARKAEQDLRSIQQSVLHRSRGLFTISGTTFMLIETRPFTFAYKRDRTLPATTYLLPGYTIAIPLPTVQINTDAYSQAFSSVPFILRISSKYDDYRLWLEDNNGTGCKHHPHCSDVPSSNIIMPGFAATRPNLSCLQEYMEVKSTGSFTPFTICLGEIAPSFYTAITTADIKSVLQCVLTFVYTSINIADPWGRTVTRFTEVKDATLINKLALNNAWTDDEWENELRFERTLVNGSSTVKYIWRTVQSV